MEFVDLRGLLISDDPLVEAQHTPDELFAQTVKSFTISDNGIYWDRVHRTRIFFDEIRG